MNDTVLGAGNLHTQSQVTNYLIVDQLEADLAVSKHESVKAVSYRLEPRHPSKHSHWQPVLAQTY